MTSPCVQVCRLEDGVCAGCGRTVEQITTAGLDSLSALVAAHEGKIIEWIETAAIRHEGAPWDLPRPARHHTVIRHISERVPEDQWPICGPGDDQGFMTNRRRYVTRREAYKIAVASGQLQEGQGGVPGILFSEDLW